MKNDKKSFLMMISSMAILGTVGVLRRSISASSAIVALFRGAIGAVFVFLFSLFRKQKPAKLTLKTIAVLSLGGVFLGFNWLLLFEAFTLTTVSTATLCYYMQPTIVLLLSPFVFKEKLTPVKIVCAVLSLVGMVFVSGVIGQESIASSQLSGILCGLGAAFFYSLVVIFNKKTGSVDTYQKTVVQLSASALVMIPYILIKNEFSSLVFDRKSIILLLTAGIVYTGISYILYFGSMKGLSAQTISALSYIDPVVALLSSAIILREDITLSGVVGAVLILCSAFAGEFFGERKKI